MLRIIGFFRHGKSPQRSKSEPHNVIIFGECGSGKSSIANMIVGEPVAKVSSSLVTCTVQHGRYETSIGDTLFNIYDTAGLNEGEQGRIPHQKAVHELYMLIRSLDGVSLLIYCIRGHITGRTKENWIMFYKELCAKKVPIIAVETGLEGEEDMNGRHAVLKKALKGYGMVPRDIACIVSVRGRKNQYENRYKSSQSRLRNLIMECHRGTPWRVDGQAGRKFAQYFQTAA